MMLRGVPPPSHDVEDFVMDDIDRMIERVPVTTGRASLHSPGHLFSHASFSSHHPAQAAHTQYTNSPHFSTPKTTTARSLPDASESRQGRHAIGSNGSSATQHDQSSLTWPHSQRTTQRERTQIHSCEPGPQIKTTGTQVLTTPIVRGIPLRSTHDLPDRFRPVFKFSYFNAIQSKCFTTVYDTDNNFVLSSPTGSGKTVVFELAICRVLSQQQDANEKMVYMAPTKALCAERTKDWQSKFKHIRVEEVTGDSEVMTLRAIQGSSLVVTTPEKWDSMTRNWKDHKKLAKMITLILIDEVHILSKDRGATLEAIISRMKSISPDIRFIAVSATVPNVRDIAVWLGMDGHNRAQPARFEMFGEDFRPVRLRKHVYGFESVATDYAFDGTLTAKLPEIVKRHSSRKPILIFCLTRASCASTAKYLADWFKSSTIDTRYWKTPTCLPHIDDEKLKALVPAGVAFHHAGLSSNDRMQVEQIFLNGELGILCCTSTLAVGVNLPAHMVIIKGTVTYEDGTGSLKELSDLDLSQMLGRAGRPQFDIDAVAVVMTRKEKEGFYNRLTSSQEVLESRLHVNLLEHLNAEIGLGSIRDFATAFQWLSGTFLSVRMQANPKHYASLNDVVQRDPRKALEIICQQALELLENHDLLDSSPCIRQTGYGAAMARYYVSFESMKTLLALGPHPTISDILSILCSVNDLREVKFRAKDKTLLKSLNSQSCILYPIPVNIALVAHKISIIVQATLGASDFLTQASNTQFQIRAEQNIIFQHCQRLIRCIVDCQVVQGDAVGIKNGLTLERSFGARIWDSSGLYLQQISGLGPVSSRKLLGAGIRNIDNLLACNAQRIEALMSKNPTFGQKILQEAKRFPRLQISLEVIGSVHNQHTAIRLAASIAFMNDHPPLKFNKKDVFVTFLAQTSDGRKLDFMRISAHRIGHGLVHKFDADIDVAGQLIQCSVACEDIAGTLQEAEVPTNIPLNVVRTASTTPKQGLRPGALLAGPGAKIRSRQNSKQSARAQSAEWDDGAVDDQDLVALAEDDYHDLNEDTDQESTNQTLSLSKDSTPVTSQTQAIEWQPERLENGNWKCSHSCKRRDSCRHRCCKEGLESKPKPPKGLKPTAPIMTAEETGTTPAAKQKPAIDRSRQTKLTRHVIPVQEKRTSLEMVDLTEDSEPKLTSKRPRTTTTPTVRTGPEKRTDMVNNRQHSIAAMPAPLYVDDFAGSGDFIDLDDLPDFDTTDLQVTERTRRQVLPRPATVDFHPPADPMDVHSQWHGLRGFEEGEGTLDDDDDEMMDMALVGAGDSYDLRESATMPDEARVPDLIERAVEHVEVQEERRRSFSHDDQRAELEAFLLQEFGSCVELV